MRIAVPTDDEKLIAAHTGRCSGFVIYSVEGDQTQKLEYRPFESAHNSEQPGSHAAHQCSHGEHEGSGHSHHGLLEAVHDCDTFLAIGMGPRLVNDLQFAGHQIIFARERDIAKVIDAIARGQDVDNPAGSACRGHGN